MRNSIDLRAEFDEWLEDYGFDILLQRAKRRIRCRCRSKNYQGDSSKCRICGGVGWVSRIERHKVRRESAVQIVSRPSMAEQTPLGHKWTDAQMFYMRHDVHPAPGDVIYEVGWKNGKPTNIIQTYRVNDINSMRGDNGRIEFWNAATKADTIASAEMKQILVRSIGATKNYEIVR